MAGNKVIKSGVWFTASNFITKGLMFLVTPIFTRLMTKAEFGDFSNINTWVQILLLITSLNLETSILRARFDFEEDLNRYVYSISALSIFSTLIWFLAALIFRDSFSRLLSIDGQYIGYMFLYLLFYPPIMIFQVLERFKYKYKWTVAASMSVTLLTVILSVILVSTMDNRLLGRVLGLAIPVVIIGSIILVYFIIKGKRVRLYYWKYALPFTLPFIPHLLSMMLLGGMDRIMIKRICGAEDAALYSLAYTSGALITLLITSVNTAYSPWLGERLVSKEYEKTRRISRPYVLAFSFLTIGVVLLSPEILLVLGGRAYAEARYVMPPVAAGCLMQFVYTMYVNVEQYEKKTGGMAVASVMAAALNFVLNYIMIPRFGYIAAAYTTYASYLFLMLAHVFLVFRIGRGEVYENKMILCTALGTSVVIMLTTFLMDNSILRFIILGIWSIIGVSYLIKNRDAIKKVLRD